MTRTLFVSTLIHHCNDSHFVIVQNESRQCMEGTSLVWSMTISGIVTKVLCPYNLQLT